MNILYLWRRYTVWGTKAGMLAMEFLFVYPTDNSKFINYLFLKVKGRERTAFFSA